MELTRKDLFKKAALAAGTGAATIAVPSVLQAASQDELTTLMDLRKCIGCEACVYACQEANHHKYPEPKKPFPAMLPRGRVPAADWSDKRDVTDRLTPYNWLYIQRATVEHEGKSLEVSVPRRCMHCQDPPCAHLCPFGAAHKEKNGITAIDPDLCFGGAKCAAVCPWNIPQRQTGVGPYLRIAPAIAGNGVMYKCDRCHDRVSRGQTPACIEACPEDVQKIGPRSAMVAEAKKIAAETGAYVYGIDENGGTNTIYLSAVPFDTINEAIEKGPGKPHLQKVENVMAKSGVLGAALIIAPLAGIAASMSRFQKTIKALFGGNDNGEKNDTQHQ
jgi:Fe-S-cluster-containing dehydrogenase component